MHKLIILIFTLALVGCDITQPVAPTPGDSDNEVSSIININIDTGTEPDKEANRAPIVTSPGNQENTAEDNIVLQIMVFDPDDNSFACNMVGEPRGLSINSSCLISGQITSSSGGQSFTTQVTASDGLATGSAVFTWTILESSE